MREREHFEDIEFEHDLKTFFTKGYVDFRITESVGGSYEGYDYEQLCESEITDIYLEHIYYVDDNTGDVVEVLGSNKEVEEIAREVIEDMYN